MTRKQADQFNALRSFIGQRFLNLQGIIALAGPDEMFGIERHGKRLFTGDYESCRRYLSRM